MEEDLVPRPARVRKLTQETPDTRTLQLELESAEAGSGFDFKPGQFCLVSVLGTGEAVFCVASPPALESAFDVTVKRVGKVTAAIHDLEIGDLVGVRGPYGNTFPYQAMTQRNLVFVAGGIGLAPLRPLIWQVLGDRERFKDVHIIYGARTPEDLVYRYDLETWAGREDVHLVTAVDPGGERGDWTGEVGLVPRVLGKVNPPSDSMLLVCGPPVMIKSVFATATGMGFKSSDIITTLEMKMKCGVGTCGRCNLGRRYVCKDGPVFTLEELESLPDEF